MSVVGRRPVKVARPSSSAMPALSAATWSPVERRAKADRVLALDAVARDGAPARPSRRRWSGGAGPRSPGRAARPGRAAPPSGTSAVGIRSRTVLRACRSRTVEVTPAGLWRSRYSGADAAPMTRPSTSMTALSGSTCIPSVAALPSTVTRPAAIRASLARRDATPGCGEDLLEPLERHQPWPSGDRRRAVRRRPVRSSELAGRAGP